MKAGLRFEATPGRALTPSEDAMAFSASAAVIRPVSRQTASTRLRRLSAASGRRRGSYTDGPWIMPTSRAMSWVRSADRSRPNQNSAPAAMPWMAWLPCWPRYTSLK